MTIQVNEWMVQLLGIIIICSLGLGVVIIRNIMNTLANIMGFLYIFKEDLKVIRHYNYQQYKNQMKLLELSQHAPHLIVEAVKRDVGGI
jgi:hypothetical protein